MKICLCGRLLVVVWSGLHLFISFYQCDFYAGRLSRHLLLILYIIFRTHLFLFIYFYSLFVSFLLPINIITSYCYICIYNIYKSTVCRPFRVSARGWWLSTKAKSSHCFWQYILYYLLYTIFYYLFDCTTVTNYISN